MGDRILSSVKKALDIQDLLLFEDEEGEGLTLAHISACMEIPSTSAHIILKTLVACGYADRLGRSRYAAGHKMRQYALQQRLADQALLARIVRLLTELSEQAGEACVLTVLRRGERVVVARAEGNQTITVNERVTGGASIYSTPTGRVLAAYAGSDERAEIIARYGMPGVHWPEADGEKKLAAECERIRGREACLMDPAGDGVIALAVPVQGRQGELLGALGTHAPKYRCSHEQMESRIRDLRGAADEFALLLS